jgi:acetyltransferase-like isoleucine patch superfamily enzyme
VKLSDPLFRLAQWVERAGTVGPRSKVARRFGAFGDGSALVFPPGALFGEEFIHIGADTLIGPHVTMSAGLYGEDLGPKLAHPWALRFGDRCSIGRNSFFVSRVGIDIGDDITMAPNVYITDHNHRFDDVTLPIKQQWMSEEPVVVGAGSWLGTGAVILPGARIGRNTVVAAGSVVRGDEYPDFCVIAGVPGKVVKYNDGQAWKT